MVGEHHGASTARQSVADTFVMEHVPVSRSSLSRGTALTTSRFASVLSEHPLIPIYKPISTFSRQCVSLKTRRGIHELLHLIRRSSE